MLLLNAHAEVQVTNGAGETPKEVTRNPEIKVFIEGKMEID